MTTDVKQEIFEKMPVPKALIKMALPTIISQIVILIYNMADTFFIGKLNNPYMVGGASLILPVFNITVALAGLAGTGGGTLVSRLLGLHNKEEAKKVATFSIYLTIGIAAVFSLGTLIFMKPLLNLLGASSYTFNYAKDYAICVIVMGAVPTILSNVLSMLLRSEGYSKESGIGLTLGGLINMALDPLFMFLLFKGNEMMGVGVATFLSNVVSCFFFIIVILVKKEKSIISFNPKNLKLTKSSLNSIFGVGLPATLSTLLFDIDYIVIDKLMSGHGDIALAAMGIVLKVERLPLNVGVGLCLGMVPLVAYNYASGNIKRMNKIFLTTQIWGFAFSIFAILIYELCAPSFIQMFINDADTVALGTNFLRIRVLATPLMFLSFSTCYVFQAYGKGHISFILAVMRWAVLNIPLLFILNKLIGMYGIVWTQVTADSVAATVSLIFYLTYRKHHLSKRYEEIKV